MSDMGHDLHREFPEAHDILHELKLHDAHFRDRASSYHEVNKDISKIEGGIEAASDERLEQLKKKRLSILDEISAMIARAKNEGVRG